MSGCAQMIPAAGGYNPRQWTSIVIAHSVPLANPDKTITFEMDSNFEYGSLRKTEGFTVTQLLPLWAGQQYIFVANQRGLGTYETRLTVTGGSAPNLSGGNAINTWLPLGFGIFWGYERSSLGITTGTWLIEIRSAATLQVLATGSVLATLQVT